MTSETERPRPGRSAGTAERRIIVAIALLVAMLWPSPSVVGSLDRG